MENTAYAQSVIQFIQEEKGCFIGVTEDSSFTSLLRSLLHKQLNLAPADTLFHAPTPALLPKTIKTLSAKGRRPFVILERRLKGQDMTVTTRELKRDFPDIRLMLLTIDIGQEQLLYLHELGVDSFIVKPVSAQTILEKLAFAINPLGEVSIIVENTKALLRENKLQEAKDMSMHLLELKPGSAAGLLLLGDAELGLGNTDAAKRAYQEANERTPLYLEPLKKLACMAEANGDMEESLSWLERLDALSPLNPSRKADMGEINLNLGYEEKAEELFHMAMDQAIEIKEQISVLAQRISKVYTANDPEKSVNFLRKALDVKKNLLQPDDIQMFNELGLYLRQQGKWKEAVTEYRRALTLAPNDAGLLYNLGMAQAQGSQVWEARQSMEAALKANARLPYVSADVAYNMGAILLKGAGKEEAKKCFAIAVEQDSGMQKAQDALEKL